MTPMAATCSVGLGSQPARKMVNSSARGVRGRCQTGGAKVFVCVCGRGHGAAAEGAAGRHSQGKCTSARSQCAGEANSWGWERV